ncbi:MAG: aldo/keto reductase [Actinobacteria bacterium]|nr:aldo/keto reductase [Actinomycetota bacterium]
MTYRRLGRSGLQVSVLSFGSWVSFGPQIDVGKAVDCLATAHEFGCNFYDNAEAYAGGESETIMGKAFAQLGWDRDAYVVSSKFFWGLNDGPNRRNTLNRKYLMQAIDGSLQRFGLDFLDLIFCHRADPNTPIEETVWAMSDIIDSGKALYWGTSEWTADEIRAAWEIADKRNLHKPVMEQPQYNLFERKRVEREYSRLYEDVGLGLTTWSPLASGLLTGKYIDGTIPDDSRGALPGYEWLQGMLKDPTSNEKVKQMRDVADELGCTLAQLSIAWCAANEHVSTVITGASRPEQVVDNFGALDVLPQLDSEKLDRLVKIARG